jgi:hypothetical protein
MRTDTHIHMTAGSPLTTIALGAAGGEAGDCTVAGLNLYTAGAEKHHVVGTRDDHVEGAVTENYDTPKSETVGGNLLETYKALKHEIITGPLTVDVTNPATYTYSATLKNESKARTEIVHGNWTCDPVEGNFKVHATGTIDMKGDADHKWLQMGDAKHMYMGAFFKLTIGSDTAINVANKNDVRVAVHTDTRVGAHIDTKLAFVMETRAGPLIKVGTLKCKKDMLKAKQSAMHLENLEMRLGDYSVWLNEAKAKIDSLDAEIHK